MGILEIIILVVVLILIFWLLDRYVVTLLPAPLGRILEAVLAIVVILWLCSRFLGLRL